MRKVAKIKKSKGCKSQKVTIIKKLKKREKAKKCENELKKNIQIRCHTQAKRINMHHHHDQRNPLVIVRFIPDSFPCPSYKLCSHKSE